MKEQRNIVDNDDFARYIQYIFDVTGKDPKNNEKLYVKLLAEHYQKSTESTRKKFGDIVRKTNRSKKEYTFVRSFDVYGKGLSDKIKQLISKINDNEPISDESLANYQKKVVNTIANILGDNDGELTERIENFDKYFPKSYDEKYDEYYIVSLDQLADLLTDIAKNKSDNGIIVDPFLRDKFIQSFKYLRWFSKCFKSMYKHPLSTDAENMIEEISNKVNNISELIDIDKNGDKDVETNIPKTITFDSDREILERIHIPFTKENLPKIIEKIAWFGSIRNIDDKTLYLIARDIIHKTGHVEERAQNIKTLKSKLSKAIENKKKLDKVIRNKGKNRPYETGFDDPFYNLGNYLQGISGDIVKNALHNINTRNITTEALNPKFLESVYKEMATPHNEGIRDFANIGFDIEKNRIDTFGRPFDDSLIDINQKASEQVFEEHEEHEEIEKLSKSIIDKVVDDSLRDIVKKDQDDKNNFNEMSEGSGEGLNVDTLTYGITNPGFVETSKPSETSDDVTIEEEEEEDSNQPIVSTQQGGLPAFQDEGTGTASQSHDRNEYARLALSVDALNNRIAALSQSQSSTDTNNILGGIVSIFKELPNGMDDEIANRLSEAVGPDGKKLFESKEEAARFIAKMKALNGNRLSSIKGGGQKTAIQLNITNKVVSNMPRKPFIVDTHPIPYQY